ncbi:MAG TPA: TadE/TadG family type IV pilus assembly protein [Terracidiphilus sp.]|jgi:Flp pilus assembly protein TadG
MKEAGASRHYLNCLQSFIRYSIRENSEGQALVETALILPIVLTIVFGILVFGIFTMQIMSLAQGVNNAGNVLSVSAGQTTDPCSLAATNVQSAAPLLSSASLTYSLKLTPSGGTAQSYPGSSCSSSSTTTGAAGNLSSGGTVQITATYTNCSLKFYGKNFLPNGCSITSTITEAVQ